MFKDMKNLNIEISFLIPAKNASSFLDKTLNSIHQFLEKNFSNKYEIILITNGENPEELSLMRLIAEHFSRNCPHFQLTHSSESGKGATLRQGFSQSNGKYVFFTDADLPYDLDFFIEAYQQLNSGYHFVTGNRRFSSSIFSLPVSVLPLAYKRHKIGLLFNKVVRNLFGIDNIDTQAGVKAFSRELGERVYSLKTCPGFLFDIEFFLVAAQNNFKHYELPIHLHLNSEKTTVKLIRESIATLRWLSKIYYQNKKKYYRFDSEVNLNQYYFITADDWGLSPSINRGILKLAQDGVVTRVSIMADGRYVDSYLDELVKLKKVELGLHFNLTHENCFKSPLDLLKNMISPFKKANKEAQIYNELERQFGIIKKMGIKVSYADGHHHCHVFPVVSKIFLNFLNKENIKESRLPYSFRFVFSQKILLLIFSLMAKKNYDKLGISYKPFFYPNFSKIHSSDSLRKVLLKKTGYEIITHPSDLADLEFLSIKDNYNHERVKEFNLLTELAS